MSNLSNWEDRLTRLARAEEQKICEDINNDPERIKERIKYLRRHLEQLEDILDKQDFK